MARKFRRLTLYEEIKKGQGKFASGADSGQSAVESGKKPESAEGVVKKDSERPNVPVKGLFLSRSANAGPSWRSKPLKAFLSVLVLAVVLITVIALRKGNDEVPDVEVFTEGGETVREVEVEPVEPVIDERPVEVVEEGGPVEAEGDHVIVIATYTTADHLEPVSDYFGKNGVETVIDKVGSYYFLTTKEKYHNTQRRGSDGWVALQEIKKIGAAYKAPSGFESFAPNLFQDAYGKKVKNSN